MLPMLFTILLLEGFITISVEVVTIRQLMPFYGGSVLITSIIIGIFLLFLALGYWRGGSYQQNFFKQLSRNFILSLLWIGFGLNYTVIAVFYYLSIYLTGLPFLLSLSLYLLLVLAPIVYWLGQTVPLTTNLFNQEQRISRISGRALFLSTIGSFLGAILTSLILFQTLGVAWTVAINCFLLFFLVLYLKPQSQLPLWQLLILFAALITITIININHETMQFEKTNNYGNYQVVETPEFNRLLRINESSSSLLTPDKKGFPYIEYLRDVLFNQLNLKNKQILIIGAGGFTFTANGTNGNEVTYVDIDPAIKEIVEKYFLKEPVKGSFIGQDARRFLRENDTLYDVIISDVYSHQITMPPSLLTQEYFQGLAEHLQPEGLFIANIIAHPLFADDYSKIVYNTIHAVFPYCTLVPQQWSGSVANILYFCPNQSIKKQIYKDDWNTSTIDFFKSRQRGGY